MGTNTELIARLRSFETDHKPEGWPAIQMRDVSDLLDAIEAQEKSRIARLLRIDTKVDELIAERDALQAQLAAAQGQVEKSEERSADYWASKYPVPLGYKLVKESWESAPPLSQDNPDFIVIPVEYQYAYPDGSWRCSNGDTINGMKPTASRALYATRNSS